jgi:hypothetical protein
LVIPLALVVLRSLFLRLGGKWCFAWALGIAALIGQLTIGLHYFPPHPLSFGLFLLGPAYSLTSLAEAAEDNRELKSFWIEPVVMLVIIWGLAAVFYNWV